MLHWLKEPHYVEFFLCSFVKMEKGSKFVHAKQHDGLKEVIVVNITQFHEIHYRVLIGHILLNYENRQVVNPFDITKWWSTFLNILAKRWSNLIVIHLLPPDILTWRVKTMLSTKDLYSCWSMTSLNLVTIWPSVLRYVSFLQSYVNFKRALVQKQ